MYENDSLFTLCLTGTLVVVSISTVLSAVVLYGIFRLARGRALVWRLVIGLIGYGLFIWLAPQVYYTYYFFYFDSLPAQIVVGAPPSPIYLGRLMMFLENANLSFHSQGALGWASLIVAGYVARKKAAR